MKLLYWLLALCVCLTAPVLAAEDKSADLAIVVNPGISIDNISSAELGKIFKAVRAKTADGVKVVLAVRETGSPERVAALKSIYQMSDGDYEKFFLQATFAGTITAAPKVLNGSASVKQFVSATAGAVSYMRASDADGSVKVLKVDGKAPGEEGYPIKIK